MSSTQHDIYHGEVKIEFTHTHARVTISSDGHSEEMVEYRRKRDGSPVIVLPDDLEIDGVDRDELDDLVCELMSAHHLSDELPEVAS